MRAVMTVLPMAFVMVAGPQIVAAILLATSVRPRRDSGFFLLGAAAATTIGLTAAYGLTGLFRKAAWHSGRDLRLEHAIDVAIVVLLLFLGVKRAPGSGAHEAAPVDGPTSKPPRPPSPSGSVSCCFC